MLNQDRRIATDNGQCTNPPRGSSVATTSQSHADLITAVATKCSTIFSITIARYEKQKTFRLLYSALSYGQETRSRSKHGPIGSLVSKVPRRRYKVIPL
jgi:hypothetical protein